MQTPYGAVYFRKSNPPRADWERDYRTAAEDGMNIFRHWFMWSCIEVAPGVYDWEDYDRQLELAAQNGIQTVIAEMLTMPEWLSAAEPELRYQKEGGVPCRSRMGGSSATGGFGIGPCLDNPKGREYAGAFLRALAERYKDHPALLGYDIWNECNYPEDICYCPHTVRAFQRWLEKKYGTIRQLGEAWRRYSYTSFDQIQPPPQLSLYPDALDWVDFRKEDFYEQMQWRADVLRSVDKNHLIVAHGTADSLSPGAPLRGHDDWLAASKVQVYGYTFVPSRRGNEPWKQLHAADLTRAASRGKPFWHAETQGGPLWLQREGPGRPREDGRITQPEDIRLWNLVSLMGGVRGFLNPRWRPLLDGPLFGAFGAYGMDGARTPRSQMASSMARWLNAPEQEELLKASPVRGEVGILVLPEAQTASRLLANEGGMDLYADMARGAYKGFLENHIQADWVRMEDIESYDLLYLPFPIMMERETAGRLCCWVEQGGTLVSESCPAYFGERGSVQTVQPGLGLDHLFGVLQDEVEFVPDLMDSFSCTLLGHTVRAGGFLQTYRCTSAQSAATLPDGRIAAAQNRFGKGKTLLLGFSPSSPCLEEGQEENRRLFAALLAFAQKEPTLTCSDPAVLVRLQSGESGRYLWAANPGRQEKTVTLTLAGTQAPFTPGRSYRGGQIRALGSHRVLVSIPARDAVVFRLDAYAPTEREV